MKRISIPVGLAAIALFSSCGGGDDAASGPDTAGAGSDLATAAMDTSVMDTDGPGQTVGGSGSGSAGAVGSGATDGTGTPLGEQERDGDGVEFVTTSSTTTSSTTTSSTTTTSTTTTSTTTTSTTSTSTTTLPPTTTTSTSTSTPTTSTSTSTSTSTTTTVPPPTTILCSFAADALFEPGEAVLTDRSIADLGTVVAGIADVRAVRVEGHTDHRGTDDENLALSQARADAAAAALTDAGVEASLITAVGLGENDAHQDDGTGVPTDEEMATDRRVDVFVDAEVPITTTC